MNPANSTWSSLALSPCPGALMLTAMCQNLYNSFNPCLSDRMRLIHSFPNNLFFPQMVLSWSPIESHCLFAAAATIWKNHFLDSISRLEQKRERKKRRIRNQHLIIWLFSHRVITTPAWAAFKLIWLMKKWHDYLPARAGTVG